MARRKCPKCKSTALDALVKERGIRRFQCRSCGELSIAPILAPRLTPIADLGRDRRSDHFGEDFWVSPFSRTEQAKLNKKQKR